MRDKRQYVPLIGLILTIVIASCMATRAGAAQAQTPAAAAPVCQAAGSLAALQQVGEASGLAASRRVPGRLWTHNDSGAPVLYAVDAKGSIAGSVRIDGVKLQDWEAIRSGPCPEGDCLYLADIGDNDRERDRISIYRIVEPEKPGGSVKVAGVVHATYPNEPQDAETLLIAPDGSLFVVTKERPALYRVPASAQSNAPARLERVSAAPSDKGTANALEITDGDVSSDGRWVALRSNTRVTFYPAPEFFAGRWTAAGRLDLTSLGEPQGEGIAFGPKQTIFLAGEGGAKQAGTLGLLTCAQKSGFMVQSSAF